MNFIIKMFDTKIRNNMRDKRREERIRNGGEGRKETSKTTFNRFKMNAKKVIL